MGRYRAVIFDLDGVLWDGEPLYFQAINNILARHGRRLRARDAAQLTGVSVQDVWRRLHDMFGLPGRWQDHLEPYGQECLRLLEQPREPLPGARELIGELRGRGIPRGVASSSWRPWVEATLRGLGLTDAFDAVVAGDEVANNKPAPDIFLRAAELMGVPPGECIVLEDSPSGLRAAKAAGMLALQVRAASTAFPPQPEADGVLERLADFDLSLLTPPAPEPRPEPAAGMEP